MVDGPDQAIVERHILLLLHETLRMMIICGGDCNGVEKIQSMKMSATVKIKEVTVGHERT